MVNLPISTLTMLHTDIENSTPLTLHLREQYPAVLATHRTLLRTAFTAYEGWEVDTQGDSFFVVFTRATQAVAAALRADRREWPSLTSTAPPVCAGHTPSGIPTHRPATVPARPGPGTASRR